MQKQVTNGERGKTRNRRQAREKNEPSAKRGKKMKLGPTREKMKPVPSAGKWREPSDNWFWL